jgi:O-antigen/teichoic acid export membrane protein
MAKLPAGNSSGTTAARLALNSLSGVSVNLATALISVFLTPFILARMGDQRFGIWAILGSVYAYSSVLQLGLYSAINRHIPMHLARDDEEKIREVSSTTTAFFIILGSLVVLLTFLCGDRVLGFFVIPSNLLSPARLALYAVGIVAAVCLGLNSFAAILSGYQRYELMALGRLLAIALRVCLVVVFLSRGEPLWSMTLIFGATECLTGLMNFIFAWRLMPARPLQMSAIRWRVLREMLGYGLNTFAYTVGALAVAKTGEVIIGAYLPPEHITYYSLALMPPMMISGLVESFAASIKPAVSDLDSRNDIGRIRELTLLTQKYVLLFVIPAMAFFLIIGNDFYRVWLHREMNQAVILLYILAPGHLVRAAQFPTFLVLAGRGEHRIFGLMTMVMGIGAIGLGLFFCRILGWGSQGVALGSTTAMAIVCGVVLPIHCAKQLGLAFRDFFRRTLLPATCGVTPGVMMLALWKIGYPPTTLIELALVAASTGLVMLFSIWFLAFDKNERNLFTGMTLASMERFVPVSWFAKIARLRGL